MLLSDLKKFLSENHEVEKDGFFYQTGFLHKKSVDDDKKIGYILELDYLESIIEEEYTCVICNKNIVQEVKEKFSGGILLCENPQKIFSLIHNYLADYCSEEKDTVIGENAHIDPQAIIAKKNVTIGKNVFIGPHTKIHENVSIGDNVVIMENCAIGTIPFYYVGEGPERFPLKGQGGVRIGNNVHIHPFNAVEQSVIFQDTVIGDNTVIDNLCLIGHDVQIGHDVTIPGGNTIGGWVEIGDYTNMGLNCAVAPNVTIGENCKVSIGGIVTKDMPNKTHFSGNFAIEHDKFIHHLKDVRGKK